MNKLVKLLTLAAVATITLAPTKADAKTLNMDEAAKKILKTMDEVKESGKTKEIKFSMKLASPETLQKVAANHGPDYENRYNLKIPNNKFKKNDA